MPCPRWLRAGAGLGLLLSLVLLPPARAEAISPQRQAELRHLLIHDCGSCHGMTMRGGLGAPLLPESIAGRSDDTLTAVILGGIRGTAMPPWASEISPEEARWLVQLLRQGGLP